MRLGSLPLLRGCVHRPRRHRMPRLKGDVSVPSRINGDAFGLTTNLRMTNPDESEKRCTLTSHGPQCHAHPQRHRPNRSPAPSPSPAGAGINCCIQITDTAPDTASFLRPHRHRQRRPHPRRRLPLKFQSPAGDWPRPAPPKSPPATPPPKSNLTDAGLLEPAGPSARPSKLTRGAYAPRTSLSPPRPTSPLQATRRQSQAGKAGGSRGERPASTLTNFNIAFPLGTGNLARDPEISMPPSSPKPRWKMITLYPHHPRPGRDRPRLRRHRRQFPAPIPGRSAHIAYNLENLRVAWGRVEMPLDLWQTSATMDAAAARGGRPAQPGNQSAWPWRWPAPGRKIPIIISDWSAPAWAVDAYHPARGPGGGGGVAARTASPVLTGRHVQGHRHQHLVCLKKNYGGARTFSFNESDLGIDVISPRRPASPHPRTRRARCRPPA